MAEFAAIDLELEWRGRRFQSVDKGLNAVADLLGKRTDALVPVARKLLEQYMEGVVKSVRQRADTPWPQGTSSAGRFPGTLSRRSGGLLQVLSPSRVETRARGGKAANVEVAFSIPAWVAVHETGATIRPRRAQYLTVPLPPALDSRGVPRKPNARAWRDTFVIKSRRGNLLIVQKRADGGINPLYVLKKEVTIPPRLAFKQAFEAGKDFLADKLAEAALEEFRRG